MAIIYLEQLSVDLSFYTLSYETVARSLMMVIEAEWGEEIAAMSRRVRLLFYLPHQEFHHSEHFQNCFELAFQVRTIGRPENWVSS